GTKRKTDEVSDANPAAEKKKRVDDSHERFQKTFNDPETGYYYTNVLGNTEWMVADSTQAAANKEDAKKKGKGGKGEEEEDKAKIVLVAKLTDEQKKAGKKRY